MLRRGAGGRRLRAKCRRERRLRSDTPACGRASNRCSEVGIINAKKDPHPRWGCGSFLVPVAGLEPARCRQRWILSPLRLPIPSHRHAGSNYIAFPPKMQGERCAYRSPRRAASSSMRSDRCLLRSAREAAMFSDCTRMCSGTSRCLGAKFQMASIPLAMS